jgi:hypothetical protein
MGGRYSWPLLPLMIPGTLRLVIEVSVVSGMLEMLDVGLCREEPEDVDTDAVSNWFLLGKRVNEGISIHNRSLLQPLERLCVGEPLTSFILDVAESLCSENGRGGKGSRLLWEYVLLNPYKISIIPLALVIRETFSFLCIPISKISFHAFGRSFSVCPLSDPVSRSDIRHN